MIADKCHGVKCPEPATTSLRLGNNFSYKDKWTPALFYCPEHAEIVGLKFADRGMRVLIEETSDER